MTSTKALATGPTSDSDPRLDRSTGTEPTIGRSASTITAWNIVSRLTGFVRVIATAAALGIAVLGDAYQRSNQVSNLLFELLAGGMLFSVLVPSFVQELSAGGRRQTAELAGVLATRLALVLGVVAALGAVATVPISAALTANADAATRQAQSDLGAVLLLFVLPQLVFYGVGAVASGLLQADHRFAATSAAPALNNLVVIATMVAFAAVHDPGRGLDLTTGEQVLLGGGTLLGTIAMTVVPLLALRRAGLTLRPRWRSASTSLSSLTRRGAWGAGHVGLNQVLVMATVLFAGKVQGGVIAYQTAFTFFLLPHAVLAHPIFTALYPRLSRNAKTAGHEAFARDLSRGLRAIIFLLLPASALLAVASPPALSMIRFGSLDPAGTRMVALMLGAYALGLAGYSTFFLLTRASYALGDARTPTLVNLGVTLGSIAGMGLATAAFEGTAALVTFGLVSSTVAIAGSVLQLAVLRRRLGQPITVGATTARCTVAALVAAAGGAAVAAAIGWTDTPTALAATAAATVTVAAADVVVLRVTGVEELDEVRARLRSLRGRLAR